MREEPFGRFHKIKQTQVKFMYIYFVQLVHSQEYILIMIRFGIYLRFFKFCGTLPSNPHKFCEIFQQEPSPTSISYIIFNVS